MSLGYINIANGRTQIRYTTIEIGEDYNEVKPELCRGCLSDSNLRPLTKRIAKIFSEFTTTENILGDEYPQYLCSICLAFLKKLFHFQTRCKRSNQLMETLKLWGRLSVKTAKNLKKTNYRYDLTLTAIENTSYKPELNRVFTKTLCIEIPSRGKTQKTVHNKPNNPSAQYRCDSAQHLPKCDLTPDLEEAFIDSGSLADRLCQVIPPLYNKIEDKGKKKKKKLTKAQKKFQYLCKKKRDKQNEMEKQKQMQSKKDIERKMKVKRKNLQDGDGSDTLTASSNCEEPDEQVACRNNLENSDHMYAKPPLVFKSQRLNEKLKSNKLKRMNDEFVYAKLIKKKHAKMNNVLNKRNSMTYKHKKQMMAAIIQIPDENLALTNNMDGDVKPDLDGILFDYHNGQSYENIDSIEDLKPDIEDIFVKN